MTTTPLAAALLGDLVPKPRWCLSACQVLGNGAPEWRAIRAATWVCDRWGYRWCGARRVRARR